MKMYGNATKMLGAKTTHIPKERAFRIIIGSVSCMWCELAHTAARRRRSENCDFLPDTVQYGVLEITL